jgi:hypothetical protein
MDNVLGHVLCPLMNTSTDRRTLIALAVVLLFWSSAFAAIRAALVAYGPYELALLRFLTASAVLGIYALASRMRLPKLRDLPLIAMLGLLGITGYHLSLNVGEVTVTAGSSSRRILPGGTISGNRMAGCRAKFSWRCLDCLWRGQWRAP